MSIDGFKNNRPSGGEKARKHRETDRVLGDYQKQIDTLDNRVSQLEVDEGTPVNMVSLDYDYPPVSISNTTTPAVVFSGVVEPAYDVMEIIIPFKLVNNTGGNRTLTVTVSVDGVTLFSDTTPGIATGANPRTGLCRIYIRFITTTSQWINAGIEVSATGAAGTWNPSTSGAGHRGYDLGAIDWSADSTVEVEFMLNAVAASTWNLNTFGGHAEVKV